MFSPKIIFNKISLFLVCYYNTLPRPHSKVKLLLGVHVGPRLLTRCGERTAYQEAILVSNFTFSVSMVLRLLVYVMCPACTYLYLSKYR